MTDGCWPSCGVPFTKGDCRVGADLSVCQRAGIHGLRLSTFSRLLHVGACNPPGDVAAVPRFSVTGTLSARIRVPPATALRMISRSGLLFYRGAERDLRRLGAAAAGEGPSHPRRSHRAPCRARPNGPPPAACDPVCGHAAASAARRQGLPGRLRREPLLGSRPQPPIPPVMKTSQIINYLVRPYVPSSQ